MNIVEKDGPETDRRSQLLRLELRHTVRRLLGCTHGFGDDYLYRILIDLVQLDYSGGQSFLWCCYVRWQLVRERSIYIKGRPWQVILFQILVKLGHVGLNVLGESDDTTACHARDLGRSYSNALEKLE